MGNVVPHLRGHPSGAQVVGKLLRAALSWELWLGKSRPGVVLTQSLGLRVWCGLPGEGAKKEGKSRDPRKRDPNPRKLETEI